MNGKVTYRQQYTRCGKQRCRKCREGEGHGPYWYAYWSEQGRTISKYIGVHLPADVQAQQAAQALMETEATALAASTNVPESAPTLRIYLLGQFQVERRSEDGWQVVDSRVWQRRRVRALLGCLLSSPGRRLGREQVMEAIWPDLEVDVAANRLNGAVHELRQILEPDIARPAASRLLRLERDIFQLAESEHIWVDADAFEQLLKDAYASSDAARAEQLLERADALYRGSYLLEELYSEWATRRRDTLQRRWIGLLLNLSRLQAERGAIPGAIEVLDRLRAVEPFNETALQHLMIFLTHIDRRGEAIQTYHRHVEALKLEYESDPLPETQALCESLRQGHMPLLPLATINRPATSVHSTKDATSATSANASARSTANSRALLARPVFHVSRHNQSPLVGRDKERENMRQVLLAVEQQQQGRRDGLIERRGHTPRQLNPTAQTSAPVGVKQPHFILLQGEPGIGKTRLAEELSLEADQRKWAVAWSRSYEQEGTIPYRPWTELLRTLLHPLSSENANAGIGIPPIVLSLSQRFNFRPERLGVLLPEWVTPDNTAFLHSLPPLPYEQERLHLWEATLGLLHALSSVHPLLLVFDDMHWTDEISIDLLSYLLHHIRSERIVVLGTCRDGELAATHKLRNLVSDLRRDLTIVTLNIQPLTQEQISTLLTHIPQEQLQTIQSQAAGNPFFAEELSRYVDTIALEGNTAHVTMNEPMGRNARQARYSQRVLPEAISAVLERRLSRLSSECQALLSKAAILGGSFELSQLRPMTREHEEDIVLDLLDEALKAGLLTEEGNGTSIIYHFWHPLIVSHLYERLSAARRALLHRKAAEALKGAQSNENGMQQEKVAARIVYHLSKGGADGKSIAHYAELAGNRAYALAAYSEAQHYYLQALHALGNTPPHTVETMQLRESVGLLLLLNKAQRYQIARHEPVRFCRLLERVAECCSVLGEFEDARHLYECVLELRVSDIFRHHAPPLLIPEVTREQQEAQLQALLWREIGNTWTATGDYDDAYESYRRAKEVMSQAGVTTGAAWACVHLQYGAMLRLDGNYHEARRYFEEALAILERTIPPVHSQSHDEPMTTAMREQASLLQKELPTRTERALIGDALELGYVYEQLGVVDASMGQLSDGLQHMHTALSLYERLELFTDTVRICGNLGAVYIMKGELVAARTYLQRSFDMAERIGDLPNMAFVTLNLGDVTSRTGDLLESENWFKRSLALSERINDREHISWCYAELASVQQDLGHVREAAQSLYRAISIGRAIKSLRCIRYALVNLGDLRLTEALVMQQSQTDANTEKSVQQAAHVQRLLTRAKSTLQRAIALGGLEAEAMIDGKLYLATAYFMQGDLITAYQMALQTMAEAQEHETARIVGRAQRLLGRIMAAQGDYQAASAYFEQAMQVFHKHALPIDYARTLHGYGTILLQQSGSLSDTETSEGYQRGLHYLREAHTIFTSSQVSIDLMMVERVLATYAIHATQ